MHTKDTPRVSVIVPNYNHENYLRQRIDSVLNQTYQDFEVILLDDCSTDNSREILESYRSHPKVSEVVFNTTNSGSTFMQWVKGFALAKGEFIWIAESDDYADEHFLEYCLEKLSAENCGFVHTNSKIVDEDGRGEELYGERRNRYFKTQLWSKDHVTTPEETVYDYLIYRCIINNASSAVFKKELLYGLDAERLCSYKNAGDFYFYLFLLSKTSCAYLAQPLNFFRYHGANITIANSKSGLVDREAFEILSEYILANKDAVQVNNAKRRKALKFVLLKFGKASLLAKQPKELWAFLLQLKQNQTLTFLDLAKLFIHLRMTKLHMKGTTFVSKHILRTDNWRRVSVAA